MDCVEYNGKITSMEQFQKEVGEEVINRESLPTAVGYTLEYLNKGGVNIQGDIGNIKPGVKEVFENNPELANAVYEALGADKKINEIANTKKVDDFIKKYKEALPNIKDGKTLISHLQTISDRNSGTTKKLADLIIKLAKQNKSLDKLLNNPNLYAKPDGVGDEGAFHWSLFSSLSVNKIVLELNHFKTNTYDDVFLHELIHNLTTQFIVKDSDLFNQNFYNKVKELYSIFDNYLENNRTINEPLLNSTKEDIKNIKRLIEYFKILPNDAIQQELLFGKIGSISTVKEVKLNYKSLENKPKNEVLQELNNLLNFKESRIKDIEKGDKEYFYFNSITFKQEKVLSEFLATFMNNAEFREKLKNIDYKNNKTLFQKIIDLFVEFLELTKNESLYNEFVLTLTNFINDNDYSSIAKQTKKTAYENRIDLLEQQKQQAQRLYSSYLQTTNNPTIEGFKQWNNRQQQINELFESNETLANAVYEAMGLTTINESEITWTDEEGNPCAKMGLTNTVKGTDWKIVKDFKGKPKHSQGGVDITISNDGVSMRRGGKDIKAKHGLLITNNI